MNMADQVWERFNGCNLVKIAESLGICAVDAYELVQLAVIRNRFAKRCWDLCVQRPQFARHLAAWFLTHPAQWQCLPTDQQDHVLGLSLPPELSRELLQHRALYEASSTTPLSEGCDRPHSEIPSGKSASPRPEPWQHPVIRRALFQLLDSDVADSTGGAA